LSTVNIRFAARPPLDLVRAPLLELLLARADAPRCEADWRARAFRVIAPQSPMPAIATAALRGHSQGRIGGWALVASPVHLVAGMRSVSMPLDGILDLEPAEADLLVADFARVFEGAGVRLVRGGTAPLVCLFDAPLCATTIDPEEVLGQEIGEFLPRGADSAKLRRLMSEMEMWLFRHIVNERRRANAAAAVSGLWLWGGGASDASLPAVQGWAVGGDPLFAAFGGPAHFSGAGGSGVAVIMDWPGSAGWRHAEQDWLAPAAGELRSGRLKQLELSAGRRCFSVNRLGMLRFWRRPRRWWERFGVRALDGGG
jgi:hypothetical protein